MVEMIQAILFSAWVVRLILAGVFFALTQWSLRQLKEYAGYALGLLLGLFFILVFISLGGGAESTDEVIRTNLNIFEVLLSTFFGIIFGVGIMIGLRIGTRYTRGVSLQIALYTALNLILLFLAFIQGPIAQRMIGIFALSVGIATLFGLVLFPYKAAHAATSSGQAFSAQSVGGATPPAAQPKSRLDNIRQQMRSRDQRQ